MAYNIIEENGRFYRIESSTGMSLGEITMADALADTSTNKEAIIVIISLLNKVLSSLGGGGADVPSDEEATLTNIDSTLTNMFSENGSITTALTASLAANVQNQIELIAKLSEIKESLDTYAAELNTNVSTLTTGFNAHVDADLSRWQDYADLRAAFYDLRAGISNKVLDTLNTVDIESEAQGGGYVVNSSLGGVVNFTTVAVLISPGTLSVNGVKVWSAAGLSLIQEIKDSYEVENGDIVTCSGMTSITFTPYTVSA